MSAQAYLIDTNVIIGLEDNRTVQPVFAALLSLAAKHKVDVLVHEAAREDIERDKDEKRRRISLSKLDKFQIVKKVRGLTRVDLEEAYGPLPKSNDVVDATLLDALARGAADFLVSEDRDLHLRARRHSSELNERVLFVADAVQLLKTTYEPVDARIKYVEEVSANEIPLEDKIFDSLREDYPGFDKWWREKCVKRRRRCWVVEDGGFAGIIIPKDETGKDTDATNKAAKILKLCTFKVRPENRGIKLGELLLKKVLWFAQANKYDLVYITAYTKQTVLIVLLEYFGFVKTAAKPDGELIYEKTLSRKKLERVAGVSDFETDRLNYPRFMTGPDIRVFGVPIQEAYHDVLYPDLKNPAQADLFERGHHRPNRPGNTIRKVYLCHAQSNLGNPGSILIFNKGKSNDPPSQPMTAVGVFEEYSLAKSTKDLMQMTAGRSVYSEIELEAWEAETKPVKVINYLLAAYIEPAITLEELREIGVVAGHPQQSIWEIPAKYHERLFLRMHLGFES